jgi:hypothetical protein
MRALEYFIILVSSLTLMVDSAQAGGQGFVFSGDQAVSARDPKQSVRVLEKISVPEIRKRFWSYSVSKVDGDCGGICVSVSNKEDFIRIDFGKDGKIRRIQSYSKTTVDAVGNAIGAPLRKAIGAKTAECQDGEVTICKSTLIKGLSYIPDEKCGVKENSQTRQYDVSGCATVDGFDINRW